MSGPEGKENVKRRQALNSGKQSEEEGEQLEKQSQLSGIN